MRALRAGFAAAVLAAGVLFGAAAPAPMAKAETAAERIVAGLSQNRVAITANFDGSEIIVYGAVRREQPAPEGPLDVIVTVTGPAAPVTVRRKTRELGIWVNTQSVKVNSAPSFYAIATTRPLEAILRDTDDLRHRITIPQAIRAIGATEVAPDVESFTEALIRLRERGGAYQLEDGAVTLIDDTLLRADVALPASLTEGLFGVRIFLLREGSVVDVLETDIEVRKEGLERFLHRLAHERPLVYGLLALLVASLAGWGASAVFQIIRR
jgi:uncharacterized protein (TIGR02186 family)